MNSKDMFMYLRSLVRQGSLRPAYARQIMQAYAPGNNVWYAHGHAYDPCIFGSKSARGDLLHESGPRERRGMNICGLKWED